MEYQVNQIVLAKVKDIGKATVTLQLADGTKGNMVMSEVSAGRIRKLREFVAPNKEIVCKILKVQKDSLELSLRRVTSKEKDYIIDKTKKEKMFLSLLKNVTKDPEKVFEKIKTDIEIPEFLEETKESSKLLEKYLSKTDAEKLGKLLASKRDKDKEVESIITLRTNSATGLLDIKEILNIKDADINYLGSSKFSVKEKGPSFKLANQKLQDLLTKIEKKAQEKKATLQVKDAK